nr:hypothetical protein [Candidatus Freyarchaeota archaeon]
MAKITITGIDEPELALEILKRNLSRRLAEIKEQVDELNSIVESLRGKYGLDWEEFKKRFENGELPEESDSDFAEWRAAIEILGELTPEERVLRELLE